jgi:hypothetical protein
MPFARQPRGDMPERIDESQPDHEPRGRIV